MKVMIIVMIQYSLLIYSIVGYYSFGRFSVEDVEIGFLLTPYLLPLQSTCINTLHWIINNMENELNHDLLWGRRRQRMIGMKDVDQMGMVIVDDVKP